jgi:hypothetical protein
MDFGGMGGQRAEIEGPQVVCGTSLSVHGPTGSSFNIEFLLPGHLTEKGGFNRICDLERLVPGGPWVSDNFHVVALDPAENLQEFVEGVGLVQRASTLEAHLDFPQLTVPSHNAETFQKLVVVDEAPRLVRQEMWRAGRSRVLEDDGHVAQSRQVLGPNAHQKAAHVLVADLAGLGVPVLASHAAVPSETERVLAVEDTASFLVDLPTGAEKRSGAAEIVWIPEIEWPAADKQQPVDVVSQFRWEVEKADPSAAWRPTVGRKTIPSLSSLGHAHSFQR